MLGHILSDLNLWLMIVTLSAGITFALYLMSKLSEKGE